MYRGFKLELPENSYAKFKDEGRKMHNMQLENTRICMTDFILKGNILDGSAIQKFWFPEIKADIFLSHSHKDLDQALAFAGWIKDTFELKVFIDSSVWMHGKDLKQKLANEYCQIDGQNLYHYDYFSHASTHVDIMLSSALTLMIDKCECLFFLDTPNSIQPYENIPRTESAWIYNEIGISKLIKKKRPLRWLNESIREIETFSKSLNGFGVSHELDLNHLTEITQTDLENWARFKNEKDHNMDALYRLVNGHYIQILD